MRLSVSLAVAVAACVAQADAEERKIAGSIRYEVIYHHETKLADGRTVSRDHMQGIIKDVDESSPIHGSPHDCFGAMIFAPDGKTVLEGHGYCDAVDKDGDVWWLNWSAGDKGESKWVATGGTGKYLNISGNGKTFFVMDEFMMVDGATPTALPNRYEGVLSMPGK